MTSKSEHVRLKAASAILSNASRFHATMEPVRVEIDAAKFQSWRRIMTLPTDELTDEKLFTSVGCNNEEEFIALMEKQQPEDELKSKMRKEIEQEIRKEIESELRKEQMALASTSRIRPQIAL